MSDCAAHPSMNNVSQDLAPFTVASWASEILWYMYEDYFNMMQGVHVSTTVKTLIKDNASILDGHWAFETVKCGHQDLCLQVIIFFTTHKILRPHTLEMRPSL